MILLRSLLLLCVCVSHCVAQCGFIVEPAQSKHWFRNEGWPLPGVKDAKAIHPFHLRADEYPKAWPDGISASLIVHKDGYQVRFPDVVFSENGTRKRLRARDFELEQLLRWEYRGTPYAYTYYLYPPSYACDAVVDIVDDRGDGKFRLMIPTPFSIDSGNNPIPPSVPEWLNKPKS
jgi:hypothetical protein